MNSEATITLKPKLGYWIARYFLLVVIVFFDTCLDSISST